MIDPRVAQANERTLLSWIRTGLALIAFGFVVERLAVWFSLQPDLEKQTTTLVLGAAIVGLGALCQVVGAARFLSVKRALSEGREPPSGALAPVALALVTAVGAVALFAYLVSYSL